MKYFFVLLLFSQPAFSQVNKLKDEDEYVPETKKNIFRIGITLSLDENVAVTGCYEHEIIKSFTVVLKGGFSGYKDFISTSGPINEQYQWSINAIASCELRYYFNLTRRIKHHRTTRNFSVPYFSIEPYAFTKPLIIINDLGAEERPGNVGAYINLGYQKQVGKIYYGVFFGTKFPGKIYSNSVDVLDIIHGGITFGYVF
jgi:hypothetical protein